MSRAYKRREGMQLHYQYIASRVQTWAEECVHMLKIEYFTVILPCLNSAHIGVACPLFFYTPLVM